MGFPCADDARSDWPVVNSETENEVVEWLLVDGGENALQFQRELYKAREVGPPHQHPVRRLQYIKSGKGLRGNVASIITGLNWKGHAGGGPISDHLSIYICNLNRKEELRFFGAYTV